MTGAPGDRGRVVGLFLAQARGTPMKKVPEIRAIEGRGLEGCRHAQKKPGHKRQVLLMDVANSRSLGLDMAALKENVSVEGIPLESLPPGQRLRIGDAVLELTGECVPCHKLDLIRPGLLKESWGRRGQLAIVLQGGVLRDGDEVALLDVNPDAPKPIRPKLP